MEYLLLLLLLVTAWLSVGVVLRLPSNTKLELTELIFIINIIILYLLNPSIALTDMP